MPFLTLNYKENLARRTEYQENYCILNKVTAFQHLMWNFYLSQMSNYIPNLFLKFHICICTFKLSFKMKYLQFFKNSRAETNSNIKTIF